jgi:hypothetical protein
MMSYKWKPTLHIVMPRMNETKDKMTNGYADWVEVKTSNCNAERVGVKTSNADGQMLMANG